MVPLKLSPPEPTNPPTDRVPAPYRKSGTPWIDAFLHEISIAVKVSPGFTACWNFAGSNAFLGYRSFHGVLAHICAAALHCGKVPDRVVRLCRNRQCVNPDHIAVYYRPAKAELLATENAVIRRLLKAMPARGHRSRYADLAERVGIPVESVEAYMRRAVIYRLLIEREEWEAETGKAFTLTLDRIK